MAARKNKYVSNETRDKIQAVLLVNRLTSFVNGEIKMEPAQVTAALGLLKKTLPDLAAMELSGDQENPIRHTFGWESDETHNNPLSPPRDIPSLPSITEEI